MRYLRVMQIADTEIPLAELLNILRPWKRKVINIQILTTETAVSNMTSVVKARNVISMSSVKQFKQDAQLPLRNRASAMYCFVAKLLSIA